MVTLFWYILIILLFIFGVPLWIGFTVLAAFMLIYVTGQEPMVIALHFYGGLDSLTLMAVPFFVIAGEIMAHCGAARYMYEAINSLVGRIRGGLPISAVLICAMYSAITGSSTATLAGVSDIAFPELLRHGYNKKYSAGIIGVSATMGPLIPPSVYMIVYGSLTQVNVALLFAAGFIPGILCTILLSMLVYYSSPTNEERRKTLAEQGKKLLDESNVYTWRFKGVALLKGMPAIIMPFIILGGIYGGFFTPTEAASVAAFYGLFITAIVYRTLNFSSLKKVLIGSATATSMVLMIVAASLVLNLAIVFERIPQHLSQFIIDSGLSGNGLLFLIIAFFLVLGLFMDPLAILFLVVPVLLPTLQAANIDLIHFCIITIVAGQISQLTPPFGMVLYVTSGLFKVSLQDVFKSTLPYMAILVLLLLIIILVPDLSLFLPNLLK